MRLITIPLDTDLDKSLDYNVIAVNVDYIQMLIPYFVSSPKDEYEGTHIKMQDGTFYSVKMTMKQLTNLINNN